MDINNLTSSDVKYLIESLKHPSKPFSINDIRNKLISLNLERIKENSIVVGESDGIEYILHVFVSSTYYLQKCYSIHLRLKSNNEQIVRVDIGRGHHNPDGYPDTRNSDHIHIYNPDVVPHDRIAFPLSQVKFPNVNNIVNAFDDFLEYTNIKNKGGS
ncbi:MAG: hypothetical protein SPF31_01665 [Lactobacillus delbrueckii]|nr:hypothetical protein [Lactobacillus delbrueckii]